MARADATYAPAARAAAPPTARHEVLLASLAAGLAGGAAMLGWLAAAGVSPGRVLAHAGATLGGEAAVGAVVWATVSIALALLYASVVPRGFPVGSAAVLGGGYAIVAMAVATSAVLPRVNPAMRAAMSEDGGTWVLAYAVFGVALALVPVVRRALGRR